MTIKELIDYQQQSGHICLIRQGLFFRAYNHGAVLLNNLLGYQIRCKHSKSCNTMLYYVGFPSSVVGKVTVSVTALGGVVVKQEDNYIEYSNVESSYDEQLLKTIAVRSIRTAVLENATTKSEQVATEIRLFDTLNSTPFEALEFITQWQEKLNMQTTNS